MSNRIEITDFTAPELDVYARIPEVQLLRFYEPKPGLFIAESPKVIQRAANAGYQPVSFLVQHKDLEKEGKELLQKFPGIPVYTADYEVLVKLTGFALTRGMLCAMTRRDLPSVEDICKNARALLLDGESIVGAYKTVRDQVIFTTHRIIMVDMQGVTGTRQQIFVLPYRKVLHFGIQTAGFGDPVQASQLTVCFADAHEAKFGFIGQQELFAVANAISRCIL